MLKERRMKQNNQFFFTIKNRRDEIKQKGESQKALIRYITEKADVNIRHKACR
jgi:hypothetical protein